MRMIIEPNALKDAIHAKLDAAFKKVPDAEKDRDILYHQLLDYFDEYGILPDFELQNKAV